MKLLRIVAIIGGLLLMLGEAYRSWGVGRPVAFWMDDMLAGGLIIWAARLVGNPTLRARAFFAASWGIASGMLYGSFFSKVFAPEDANPGNFGLGFLTAIIGVAFVIAVVGTIASILLISDKT